MGRLFDFFNRGPKMVQVEMTEAQAKMVQGFDEQDWNQLVAITSDEQPRNEQGQFEQRPAPPQQQVNPNGISPVVAQGQPIQQVQQQVQPNPTNNPIGFNRNSEIARLNPSYNPDISLETSNAGPQVPVNRTGAPVTSQQQVRATDEMILGMGQNSTERINRLANQFTPEQLEEMGNSLYAEGGQSHEI